MIINDLPSNLPRQTLHFFYISKTQIRSEYQCFTNDQHKQLSVYVPSMVQKKKHYKTIYNFIFQKTRTKTKQDNRTTCNTALVRKRNRHKKQENPAEIKAKEEEDLDMIQIINKNDEKQTNFYIHL